jgi:hypothetical protein
LPQPLSTKLTKKRWSISSVAEVGVRLLLVEHAAEADRAWPATRKTEDWHVTWKWRQLVSGKPEAFAVVDLATDRVTALWCTAQRRPAKLRDGLFYRPDFLEVAPPLRGGDMGVFLFQLIAARALEVGANGIMLATWPPLRAFYAGLGGTEGPPHGWRPPANLIPFTFASDALGDLVAALMTKEKRS